MYFQRLCRTLTLSCISILGDGGGGGAQGKEFKHAKGEMCNILHYICL